MTLNIKDKLKWRLENEIEIYILMIIFTIWYYLNIGGAIIQDETIYALQGYYLYKGDMPAEQFRPMGRYFFGLGQLMFGRTTFGTKFFNPIFGILTIYLSYRAVKILSNRVYALFPALIVGIIPLYGDLSVSGLMDIMMAFFVMLLFFFTLKYIQCQDIIKKQRLLFVLGFLSIATFATKLYGAFFSLVIFLFIIYSHRKIIKTIKIFKFRNMKKRFKKNIFLIPIFLILGALFGLLTRAQLSDLWESGGEQGRKDVLGVLPEFLDNMIINMDSSEAYTFFILIGVMIFFFLWIIAALVGRESLRALKCLYKKKLLDKKYNVLIFIMGAAIGFLIIYSPYIHNPITLFTQIILNQTIRTSAGAPRTIAGVQYENAPWWSYFYWTYFYLGLMFVIGLLISILYTVLRFIKKEKIKQEENLLVFYILIPFIFMTLLKVKNGNYYVMFFPLFSIYLVVQITSIVKKAAKSSSSGMFKNNTKLLPVLSIILLMLLPGPLLMTLEDPKLGWDSGYDKVGDLIIEYVEDHPGEDITILAYDILSVEFYLPDEILNDVRIIFLFSDNFSKDILGRPYIYIPDDELLNMTQNNEIHILVDEPNLYVERESETRSYIANHYTKVVITDDLVVYRIIT